MERKVGGGAGFHSTTGRNDWLDPDYIGRLTRRYAIATALSVAGAALSFLVWEAGLALALGVILFYLRAPETPVYPGKTPDASDG